MKIIGLERHTHAPELNKLHFETSKGIKFIRVHGERELNLAEAKIEAIALDYINNWLSLERCAIYYGLTPDELQTAVEYYKFKY